MPVHGMADRFADIGGDSERAAPSFIRTTGYLFLRAGTSAPSRVSPAIRAEDARFRAFRSNCSLGRARK